MLFHCPRSSERDIRNYHSAVKLKGWYSLEFMNGLEDSCEHCGWLFVGGVIILGPSQRVFGNTVQCGTSVGVTISVLLASYKYQRSPKSLRYSPLAFVITHHKLQSTWLLLPDYQTKMDPNVRMILHWCTCFFYNCLIKPLSIGPGLLLRIVVQGWKLANESFNGFDSWAMACALLIGPKCTGISRLSRL